MSEWTAKQICEHLQQLLDGMGVERSFFGEGSSYTITFDDSHGHVGGLRIYRNGEQLIGMEKLAEDFAAGKTVFNRRPTP